MKVLFRAVPVVSALGLLAAYALASIAIGSLFWPLDVIGTELDLVKIVAVPDRGQVGIFQEWNDGDFYNTYLIHIDDQSKRWVHLLDPDNSRLAANDVRLEMENDAMHVAVYFGDVKAGVYGIEHHEFDFANDILHGGTVYPLQSQHFPKRLLPEMP